MSKLLNIIKLYKIDLNDCNVSGTNLKDNHETVNLWQASAAQIWSDLISELMATTSDHGAPAAADAEISNHLKVTLSNSLSIQERVAVLSLHDGDHVSDSAL